jgi:CubicO group peptidase (beta-lactamase class C family)
VIAPAAFLLAVALTSSQRTAIDKLVATTMKSEHIAGASVVVSIGNTVALKKSWGYADVASRVPATNDTVYPIGSITKQFTAACVLLLAQDGKLSIDDPLSRYVSGLPWADKVTLRHLLDQESGVVDFRFGVIDVTTRLAQSQVIDQLKQTDLMFAPGSKYEYSNSNYYLLGMVVEKVSGKTYPQFLRDRILTPLALKATYYNDGSAPLPALARGHVPSPNGPQPIPPESADWSFAAGAIASTASDLSVWDDAVRDGKVLGKPSLLEMFTPGTLDNGGPTDYAFGWVAVRHNGAREIWHNGEVTGFHAMNATYPDQRTDVVVLTNTGQTFAADALAVQIYDVLHPYTPSSVDRAAAGRAKEWLGRILHDDIDRTQLTDQMSAALDNPHLISAAIALRSYGRTQDFKIVSVDDDSSGRNYNFKVAFAKQSITWVMGIDKAGKISALYFHL